jgi:hypothetical protein
MDNIVLNGPQGSPVNIGSWLRAEPGPDFGSKDLQKLIYAENPAADGGRLALESAGVRHMSFPLLVGSHSVGGAPGLQGLLRLLARPGATLDVQLDGMASADAVRFDVSGGRLEDDYDLPMYRGAKRLPMVLKLDTQPFAYWPTTILLASAASVGLPGQLAIPAASVLGDVPGLSRLVISPTVATQWSPGAGEAIMGADVLAYSVAARPSFVGFWPAPSILYRTDHGGTLIGDANAIGSQAVALKNPPLDGTWRQSARIVPGPEGAYRGRFRLFVLAKFDTPSGIGNMYAAADTAPQSLVASIANVGSAILMRSMGSAGPIATIPAFTFYSATTYSLRDLGEVTLPETPSGVEGNSIRLYARTASSGGQGVSTVGLRINGIYLLPVDGDAAYLSAGLAWPRENDGLYASVASYGGRLVADGIAGRSYVGTVGGDLATDTGIIADARSWLRGAPPRVSPSITQLDLCGAARTMNHIHPDFFGTYSGLTIVPPMHAAVSVQYRPRFAFLKGI